jgi:hypothetical protein
MWRRRLPLNQNHKLPPHRISGVYGTQVLSSRVAAPGIAQRACNRIDQIRDRLVIAADSCFGDPFEWWAVLGLNQ